MQTVEKIATNGLEELLRKVAKLERVAELAVQLRETYGDKLSSYNEKQYVLEKLDESLQEYELFLNN